MAIVFYACALVILGGAVMMITARNLVHAVVWMVVSFIGVGALFVALEAEFVAAVQVLVYAGGIVVLFLFVIMLVNLGGVQQEEWLHRQWLPALLLAVLLLGEIGFLLWAGGRQITTGTASTEDVLRGLGGNVQTVGMTLYTDYLLPFEIVSMLLLVAMIGAIYLAKREI